MIVFGPKFMDAVFARMDLNEETFKALLDHQGFQDEIKTSYGRDLYRQLHDQREP